MSNRSWKEKWENYWYYYKIHTLIGIFIIFVVGYTVANFQSEKPVLHVTYIGSISNETGVEQLQNAATAAVLHDPQHKSIISIDHVPMKGLLTDPVNEPIFERIVAMTVAQTLDVVIADQADFAKLSSQGMFMNLDKLLTDSERSKLSLVKDPAKGDIGVSLTGNQILQKYGFPANQLEIGVIVNTQHTETAVQFLRWLTLFDAKF